MPPVGKRCQRVLVCEALEPVGALDYLMLEALLLFPEVASYRLQLPGHLIEGLRDQVEFLDPAAPYSDITAAVCQLTCRLHQTPHRNNDAPHCKHRDRDNHQHDERGNDRHDSGGSWVIALQSFYNHVL